MDRFEFKAYLAFARGIFIYEIRKVDKGTIEEIVNTIDRYSTTLDKSLLKKSKERLSRKGFVGAATLIK